MSQKPTVLICCRADNPLVVRGSVYDHHCSKCGSRVMTAPSGQAFLRLNPDAAILCVECYQPQESDEVRTAAPIEDMLREHQTVMPNLYRERN